METFSRNRPGRVVQCRMEAIPVMEDILSLGKSAFIVDIEDNVDHQPIKYSRIIAVVSINAVVAVSYDRT